MAIQAVLATEDGAIWIGNRGSLDVLRGTDVQSIKSPGLRVTSLSQDHAKRLRVGVDNMLTIYDQGQFRKITRPDGSPLGGVVAITEDGEQNVWVSVVPDRRLFRIRDLRVKESFVPARLLRVLAADPAGGIWAAAVGNLGHYGNGKLDTIPLQNSLSRGPGMAVDADGSVWVSTALGLTHWEERPDGNTHFKNRIALRWSLQRDPG